ncbi:hypothetical protein Pelo_5803 [Pelomyxa schiedti]|nr:hypothetical protein Pelo_5803 [Pelomyxa schiedti]
MVLFPPYKGARISSRCRLDLPQGPNRFANYSDAKSPRHSFRETVVERPLTTFVVPHCVPAVIHFTIYAVAKGQLPIPDPKMTEGNNQRTPLRCFMRRTTTASLPHRTTTTTAAATTTLSSDKVAPLARDQFLALAAAVLVPRCGSCSPARHLPLPVLLADLATRWILPVSRDLAFTLLVGLPQPAHIEALVHVFAGVSATGGLAGPPRCLVGPSESWVWERGPYISGSLGRGRFLAVSHLPDCERFFVLDQEGRGVGDWIRAWRGFHEEQGGGVRAVGNTRWVVIIGYWEMLLWRVVGGELVAKAQKNGLDYRMHFGGSFAGEDHTRSSVVAIPALHACRSHCVIFVDLERTFDYKFTVVREVDVPSCGVADKFGVSRCMCVGDDLFTISCSETQYIICNLTTGITQIFNRPCFLEVASNEHICVHRESTLSIYHVRDLVNPCMSFPSFGVLESNPHVGFRTGIVSVPSVPATPAATFLTMSDLLHTETDVHNVSVSYGLFDVVTVGVTVGDLVGDPSSYAGQRVYVKGRVAALTNLDTFSTIELGEADGEEPVGTTLHVRGESDMFTFPVDCTAATAVVEALFDAADPYTLRLYASAVTLSAEKAVCESWKNIPIEGDLEQGSLYGDGMGAGLVVLEPGGIMDLHSTDHSSEMVNCIEGTIQVMIDRGSHFEQHTLSQYHSIYIPHSTPHMVQNTGTATAKYVYVHANVPVRHTHTTTHTIN